MVGLFFTALAGRLGRNTALAVTLSSTQQVKKSEAIERLLREPVNAFEESKLSCEIRRVIWVRHCCAVCNPIRTS
jgi:hypothetical protein